MGKKKPVESGSVKDRPKRVTASASAQKVLHSPVLNVLADLHRVDSSENDPSLKQERDAFVEERRKVLCSTHLNVPPGIFHAPEYNIKLVAKESLEYQSKSQAALQLCHAIDEEVKSRSAAIRTLTAAQYSSYRAQIDLQLSKFSPEEQSMPLEEFLKTCPGIKSEAGADGRIQLQKRSSPYPKLEESKRNLQDLLTKVNDGTSKGTNFVLFTPCPGPTCKISCDSRSADGATPCDASEREQQEPEQKLVDEELSWPEYYKRLQTLGFNAGLTPSVGNHNNMNTPMIFKGGLAPGVTPKTLRLPKHGEAMLSVNGSPLGQFGKTPASVGGATRMTRTSSRLASSSKRSMRDL